MRPLIAQRQAFGEALVAAGRREPRLVVFDGDVCVSTQTSLFREAFPERFYQMGIAEANMVGVAAAMSTLGFIPMVSTFAVFLCHRALDQVRVAVSYANTNVKLNGAYGGIPTGKAGATHSSLSDIADMRALPNMRVLVPADAAEVEACVELALSTEGPVYLRSTRDPVEQLFTRGQHRVHWGEGVLLADGDDVGIISTGMMTAKALQACQMLAQRGIKASLLHLCSLKPVDQSAILRLAQRCGRLVTVENHSMVGGLGSLVAELTSAFAPTPLLRIGIPDVFIESGENEAVFAQLGMSIEAIANRVELFVCQRGGVPGGVYENSSSQRM